LIEIADGGYIRAPDAQRSRLGFGANPGVSSGFTAEQGQQRWASH